MPTTLLARNRHDYEELVTAASQAPSVHNTQPWRFVVRHEAIEVHANPERGLPTIDPHGRELTISCGAAIFNLRVAASGSGWHARVHLLPHPDVPSHLATIDMHGPCRPHRDDLDLVDAIWRRRTNRQPFSSTAVPIPVLAEMVAAAHVEGSSLHVLDHEAAAQFLSIAAAADHTQRDDAAYRAELLAWTSRDPSQGDGVPRQAFGPRPVGDGLPVRDFGLGELVRPTMQFEAAPCIATLMTLGDSKSEWLRAGQALQRVLLTATARGVDASFITQPLEVPWFRPLVRAPGVVGAAQVVLRFGYGRPVLAASPRRPSGD